MIVFELGFTNLKLGKDKKKKPTKTLLCDIKRTKNIKTEWLSMLNKS